MAADGHVLVVEPAPDLESAAPPPAVAGIPGDPAEGSRPGAPYTLFLDFDGATIENAQWNEEQQELSLSLAPAAAADAGFQAAVWAHVAEDFAAFDVNVTTADPGADALNRTSPTMPSTVRRW